MSATAPKTENALSSKLQKFLLRHMVAKGNAFTHTSLGKPFGSFYIPSDNVNDFYKVYTEALEANEEIYLTEKHRHISPFLIDLDFRFSLNGEETPSRKYSTDDIKEILSVYGDEIKKYFEVDTPIYMYVMEKPHPTIAQKRIKDGIHIVIPEIVSKPALMYIIRQNVIQKLKHVFERMGALNNVDEIVDEAVIERNNWLMYGSRKPGGDAYKLTDIYEFNMHTGEIEVVTDQMSFTLQDLVIEMSIRNKHEETPIKGAKMPEVHEYNNVLDTRRRKMETSRSIIAEERNNSQNEYHNIEEVHKLVDILSDSRANNYNDWIRLGWCLRNIDYRLLDKWNEFSKKSPKFRDGECESIWNNMKLGGLGIGTLHMWAKNDNIDKYNEVVRIELRKLIYESKTATHHDVARVVHYMFQYEYVCTSIKNKFWYEFRNHRWIPTDCAFSLRLKLSNEVWKEYMAAARDLSHAATQKTDVSEQDKCQEFAKKMIEIAQKLKTTSFKDNVMKESAELFYREKFEEKLDASVNLVGFENGVYDLDSSDFREGRPDDYISFSTGVNYRPYDPSHKHIIGIRNYMAQVLTKPQVREYVLKLFASFLHGSVKDQKFYIWTGSGSNSKSKLVELFEKAFGDYCCKFPITLLTQKRVASNAANSELARAKGKRFASLQEPSEDEKLNIGLMKELSGGDKVMARSLFKEPIEFLPQFKMILLCNHLPHVPSDDGGTWRRIRVVEFTSKFVENPVEENEFPIDFELSSKLEAWKEHFMSMLLEYYKLYKTEGITEPEDVLACTREYKRQNDHLADFIHNCVEKKDGGFLTLNDAFSELKSWAKEDNIQMKIPTKAELEKYLSKNLAKCVCGNNVKGYKGYRLKNRMEIIDDADNID